MLGIDSIAVWLAGLISLAATLFCLGYGLLAGRRERAAEVPEDRIWLEEEREMEEGI